MICPKCAFEQPDGGGECARCGVIFAKIHAGGQRPPTTPLPGEGVAEGPVDRPYGFFSLLRERILAVPPQENRLAVAGRAVVYAVLAAWGLRLMTGAIQSNQVGESFLHMVNLPFHEAGHVLFTPFGRFLQVLGGTLGQWLAPFAVLCSFLAKGNPFGASVGLWWLGESFLDIAPYMNDARAGQLMLLGGVTGSEVEDYHDWEVILTRLGWLQHDHLIARISFGAGTVLMTLSLIWGAYILRKQFKDSA